MPQEHQRALNRTLVFGVVSVMLYVLLYLGADLLLAYSKQGGSFFIVPASIAFRFSIMHGNFTSHFRDLSGLKAKSVKK